MAEKILMEAVVAGDSDETLNRLKRASDNLVRCALSRHLHRLREKLAMCGEQG